MKTIAISIEEDTVDAIDKLVRSSRDTKMSRSRVVRLALGEYLARRAREEREARERKIVARHRELLTRQAEALVEEQAEL